MSTDPPKVSVEKTEDAEIQVVSIENYGTRHPDKVNFLEYEPENPELPVSFYNAKTQGMYVLSSVVFWGADAVMLTDEGTVLEEQNYGVHPDVRKSMCTMPQGVDMNAPVVEHQTVLSLVSSCSYDFSHWMLDSLPKVAIAETMGYHGKYLVPPQYTTPWVRETFELLGVDPDRTIEMNAHAIKATVAFIPTHLSGTQLSVSRDIAFTMRESFLSSARSRRGSKRRIYIPRRGDTERRRIVNDPEVSGMLEAHGFTEFNPEEHSVQEQIEVLSGAQVVIGSHSPFLAHALLMRPGSTVVEFFNQEYVSSRTKAVCDVINVRHVQMVSELPGEANTPPQDIDICVDLEALKGVLDEIEDFYHVDLGFDLSLLAE